MIWTYIVASILPSGIPGQKGEPGDKGEIGKGVQGETGIIAYAWFNSARM